MQPCSTGPTWSISVKPNSCDQNAHTQHLTSLVALPSLRPTQISPIWSGLGSLGFSQEHEAWVLLDWVLLRFLHEPHTLDSCQSLFCSLILPNLVPSDILLIHIARGPVPPKEGYNSQRKPREIGGTPSCIPSQVRMQSVFITTSSKIWVFSDPVQEEWFKWEHPLWHFVTNTIFRSINSL